jgi:hypothetical protein
MALLRFVDGSRPPHTVNGDITIGSGESCAVRLQDTAVSAQHARLVSDGTKVLIQDLDSFGGTLRNGEFVYGQQPLADGDVIQIGPFKLKFFKSDGDVLQRSDEDLLKTPPLGMPSLYDDDDHGDGRTVQMDAAQIAELMAQAPVAPAAPSSDGPAPLPLPPSIANSDGSPVTAPDSSPIKIEAPAPAPVKSRSQAAYQATLPPVDKDELERIKKKAAARRTVIGMPPPTTAPQKPQSPALQTLLPSATARTMALEPVTADPTKPTPAPAPAPAPIPVTDQPTGKNREDATAKTMQLEAPPPAPAQPPPAAPPAPTPPTTELAPITEPTPKVSWWQRLMAFFARLFRRR